MVAVKTIAATDLPEAVLAFFLHVATSAKVESGYIQVLQAVQIEGQPELCLMAVISRDHAWQVVVQAPIGLEGVNDLLYEKFSAMSIIKQPLGQSVLSCHISPRRLEQ